MSSLKGRDLLSIADLSSSEMLEVLNLAADLKVGKIKPTCPKTLGLLFYKASTRTRVSFSVAMYELGGNVIDLNPSRTQVGRGEPLKDTARVLDGYLDILAIRTFDQQDSGEGPWEEVVSHLDGENQYLEQNFSQTKTKAGSFRRFYPESLEHSVKRSV